MRGHKALSFIDDGCGKERGPTGMARAAVAWQLRTFTPLAEVARDGPNPVREHEDKGETAKRFEKVGHVRQFLFQDDW
jgi:hypothetical protein